ncbi:caspase family protein [Hymenobacter sp. HDW8]|uniref:caspase family protein n=1 Tax=Hymenobacter sp. HDW8 TaxID=2714932 RepID=UPI00140CDB28|nr:caspase family protein [Hymenobacter sp. HDW8]QIL74874.1 peptidase C14 [Hymenobacter sp. HDW8]
MADRFKQLTLAEFIQVLNKFPFTRRINAVHMHHTWRPNRAQYQGMASITAMWKYHTQHNGWSDIAQHITIAPDGTIWTGRNWNLAPASSGGHNGNSQAGPFMFEMIGDFDKGRDPFDGAQRHTALHVVAHVLHRFKLPAEALHFHNQMSVKTCPGSSINYAQTVGEARRIMDGLGSRSMPTANESIDENQVAEALAALRYVPIASRTRNLATEALAEPAEEGMSRQEMHYVGEADPSATRGLLGAEELSPAELRSLRPHVVNLDQGHFSPGGICSTSPADVDAIFDKHLEQALAASKTAKRPLHVLLYAHGGLVSEKSGLSSAARYVPWWLANHVYPLYFVWETGLCGTLGAIIRGTGSRELARGVTDLTDRLVEKSVGKIGGLLWRNMKDSAEGASAPDGGAYYVARRLQRFCHKHAADVRTGALQLHAAGHSAGSIFHAHFLPLTQQLGVPAFRTLHLLAPAIRVDEFKNRLARLVGTGVQHLTLYTMRDKLELADTCSLIYRKSLLYLVYYALEAARETPILGLDSCLSADEQLRTLLGLKGAPQSNAEVVWSKTTEATGRSSSTSTSHSGFDDDAATMESVLRRILNTDKITPFPKTRDLTDPWHEPVELPEEMVLLAQAQAAASSAPPRKSARPSRVSSVPTVNGNGRHHQRALCIGIDDYPAAPLAGCVADAKNWAHALRKKGFETALLLNEAATRSAILDTITKLVTSSKPGDVVVIQYSGHGTTLPDLDRDEDDSHDEALCPHDYATGAFVVDDDLRVVFQRIPVGVNVTCFMDCCHSGSNTRLLTLVPPANPAHDSRPRFMRATEAIKQAHSRFRKKLAQDGAALKAGSREEMRVVNFTACQPWEVAYESDGSGDFTVRALPLLTKATTDTTHSTFLEKVVQAFGKKGIPRQHPTLDCTDEALQLPLLRPLQVVAKAKTKAKATRKKAVS